MERTQFTQAVEQFQNMVYRSALHTLGSPQDADDAVQEVFLRLYRERKPFQDGEHLRRWLLRVTVNYCRDVLKSPWRKRRVSLEDAPERLEKAAEPDFERPEQAALYQAVLALPEKYRTILNLFYYEELSVREIGELLGIKTSVVTTRLSRARAQLKMKLGEVWQDE